MLPHSLPVPAAVCGCVCARPASILLLLWLVAAVPVPRAECACCLPLCAACCCDACCPPLPPACACLLVFRLRLIDLYSARSAAACAPTALLGLTLYAASLLPARRDGKERLVILHALRAPGKPDTYS